MNSALEKMLQELARDRFWGQLTVEYQDGQPAVIRKTQVYKLKTENTNGPRQAETRSTGR